MTIRILLAEDQSLIRESLRALLERTPGFEVVGEAVNGREAVALTVATRPDVVLMDIGMPELNGIEATARVRAEAPGTRVIMLTSNDDDRTARRAVTAGAHGYVLKADSGTALAEAVRTVARGGVGYGTLVGDRLGDWLSGATPAGDALERLSPRQREILQLIAEGRTTKEIAYDLKLSVSTVVTHRTELMRRLDIHDVAGLVRFAYRAGVLTAS